VCVCVRERERERERTIFALSLDIEAPAETWGKCYLEIVLVATVRYVFTPYGATVGFTCLRAWDR